ncbi:LysR family transcriptional regulator [Paracandidimonas soli]|uniref:LysR family transcriptional regulator n=1 Tax=Paracandidimonas soli TaxID=1917182 RepID=A0A4R3VB00_9BURK|nr:LysR family transcriptional regulator [Paracandidimonas soli]TCV00738.1 LysR family transcriptional regulator [Paracandidimonas soli]
MQLTLRQFEYFLALAETGQVSKAALRCNVSQSSVTVALRSMEQALGVSLFIRHSKGLRLTEAGERFVSHARNVTNAAARAIEDVRAAPSDMHGRLRVGVTETISAYLIPSVLSMAEQRFPNLRIQVVESDRPSIEQALMDGSIDFALLIVSNLARVDALEYRIMLQSPRRLWTPPDHPLQQKSKVSLRDIAQFDYVLLDMDEHVHTMEKYWRDYRLWPNISFQSKSLEAVRSLVAFQKGVTILSDLVYRPWSLEGRRILRSDVSEIVPTMDIGGVWRKNDRRTKSREALLDFLHASIKALAHE